MERKTMPRVTALLLAFALVCASLVSAPVDAQAAAKANKIKLSATKQTMYVKGSFTLKVKSTTPKNASKAVTYKSSNKKVATVNGKGKVVAKSVGTATITVTSKGNKKAKATCKITVKEGVKSIQTASNLTMQKGKKVKLNYGVTPANVEKKAKKMTFSTNKKSVVTVDKKGQLKAKKTGSAKITIQSAGASAKATVKVKVVKKLTPVKKIALSAATLSLNTGASETLKATVTPKKATSKKVYWVSSNSDVASVNKSGKVTALKDGVAKITAYATDTSAKKATCTVTVTTAANAITLDQPALSLKVGDAPAKLTATVAPENATDKTVTWAVDNAAIATVTPEGASATITPVAAGTATVTATTVNGLSATCVVTVAPADPVAPVEEEKLASSYDGNYKFSLNKAAKEYRVKGLKANTLSVSAAEVAADYATLAQKVELGDEYWNNDFFKNQWTKFNSETLSAISAIFAGVYDADVTVEGNTITLTYGNTVATVERIDAEVAGQPCSLKVTKGDKVIVFSNVTVSKVDGTVKIQAASQSVNGNDVALTAEITKNSVKLYKGADSAAAHNVIMTLDVTDTAYEGFINGTNYGHIAEMLGVSVDLAKVELYNYYK